MDLGASHVNYFDDCLEKKGLREIFISPEQILRGLFISLTAVIQTNLSPRPAVLNSPQCDSFQNHRHKAGLWINVWIRK